MTAAALQLDDLSYRAAGDVAALVTSRRFDQFADQLARVGNCARPIRLVGASETIYIRTGELVSTYCSNQESDGVTRIACGNRRASVCPACSRRYAADTWHLIHAGAAGGKGVPETVAVHPMVFATATAPSFGAVHAAHRTGKPCRPRRNKLLCQHGRPTWCSHRHTDGEQLVGKPLCTDCYDYDSHVVWQWFAPELWRRFTIALSRGLARHLGVRRFRLGDVATVQYAKVGEYQRRGVIHFHALIRLDGPKTPAGFEAPLPCVDAEDLAGLVRMAFAHVSLTAPRVDKAGAERRLKFGRQIDAHPVTRRIGDESGALTPEAVAGYIAKYATKTIDDPDTYDPTSSHHQRLRETVAQLAAAAKRTYPEPEDNPYELLGKWEHMLGFRGHFSSKSRRYSTTLGRLRRARQRWHVLAAKRPRNEPFIDVDLDDEDDDETTLVLRNWRYAGQGWATEGQAALAIAAAARARERQQEHATNRPHRPMEA